MNIRLAAKRVNRVITIPKPATTVLRPNSKLLRPQPASAVKVVQPKQVRTTATPTKRSTVARVPATRQPRTTVVRDRVAQKPKVTYAANKEISNQDKNKLLVLKGTGKGRILVIVGNGPSINETNLRGLTHHPQIDLMSINKPVNYLWPTKYWLFCDNSQYVRHQDLWSDYEGIIFNTMIVKHRRHNSIQLRNIPGFGYSTDLVNGFYVGRSSVYAAMQVATWLDYDHVYIVGCDMAGVTVGNKLVAHFFGVNPDVSAENRVQRFTNEAKHYDYAASSMSSLARSKFTFCSSYNQFPFVDKFGRLGHLEAVEHILRAAS